MRLQKFMAHSGIASRRKSEKLIQEGRVRVNGKTITKLGSKVDPSKDKVYVDDQPISLESNKVYIMLNKPTGYVTTLSDEKDRRIVTDLISNIKERIYPVGRLDMDTSGLLLMTNDGDLTHKLTHPSYEITKRYIARVKGIPSKKDLKEFREGLIIDNKLTSPAKIKIVKKFKSESILDISIYEGRNRQVRKMCEKINHPVRELERISIGRLRLANLPLGKWRYLDSKEVNYLKSL